jgi:hypothetical protein
VAGGVPGMENEDDQGAWWKSTGGCPDTSKHLNTLDQTHDHKGVRGHVGAPESEDKASES